MPEPQRSPEPDAWPGQPEFDEPVEPDRHTGGRHRRDQPRHAADLPPDHPGHQEPFPRRRKPEGAAEQYPHETPRRYPGGGAHIEGVPEPPPRRTPDER